MSELVAFQYLHTKIQYCEIVELLYGGVKVNCNYLRDIFVMSK